MADLSDSALTRKLTAADREREALLAEQAKRIEVLSQGAAKYGSKARGGASRILEDTAFFLGLLLIASRAVIEMGQEIDYWPMPEEGHSFAGILVEFLRSSLLVAPKILGRATAGGVWTAVGSGVGKLVGRGKPGAE